MPSLRSSYVLISIVLTTCAGANTSQEEITDFKPELSASEESNWNLMTGRWYGSQPTKEGGLKQEIADLKEDGTYKIVFKVRDRDGSVERWEEVGQWGISGNIHFTIHRGWLKDGRFIPSDATDPYKYDAYEVLALTEERFRYRHVSTGNEYVLKKISSGSWFPE